MIASFVIGLVIFSLTLFQAVNALSFLAIGDWGGMEYRPYYTPGQAASVIGMDKVATALKSQFVLAVGDNFYHEGVIDEFDDRFKATFENVYSPSSLQTPWYAVLGNHDYKGNTTAQIEYTKYSARWHLPTNYYTKSFTAEDGATIDVIVIDTVNLASSNEKSDEAEAGYFDPLPLKAKSFATEQWTWIENQLSQSKADYILVSGHYPVYSACEHGNTESLISHLLPLLQQYNAHYLSGHDHCMEHIVDPAAPSVNHFLSGMGATCCYRLSNRNNIPKESLQFYVALDNREGAQSGFTSFEVSKSALVSKYYNQDGTLLYTAPSIAPRVLN